MNFSHLKFKLFSRKGKEKIPRFTGNKHKLQLSLFRLVLSPNEIKHRRESVREFYIVAWLRLKLMCAFVWKPIGKCVFCLRFSVILHRLCSFPCLSQHVFLSWNSNILSRLPAKEKKQASSELVLSLDFLDFCYQKLNFSSRFLFIEETIFNVFIMEWFLCRWT